jgi:hypothetical protein
VTTSEASRKAQQQASATVGPQPLFCARFTSVLMPRATSAALLYLQIVGAEHDRENIIARLR